MPYTTGIEINYSQEENYTFDEKDSSEDQKLNKNNQEAEMNTIYVVPGIDYE